MSPHLLITQTLFALLAFAGNSVLCRLALQDESIDATSFTALRLISGALILCVLIYWKSQSVNVFKTFNQNRFKQGAYLFVYAAGFSYSYILLGTAVGALVLFVTVQITMLAVQVIQGRSVRRLEVIGLSIALMSFITWMLPDSQRPHVLGLVLMVIAGIAWGLYTLAGKASTNPQQDTAQNFLVSVCFLPLIIPVFWLYSELHLTDQGVLLAITSGAVTSGLGYWVWYKVLPHFSALSAGVMQLSVPVLAAFGGIIWNQESLELNFILASLGILAGIFLVLYSHHQATLKKP